MFFDRETFGEDRLVQGMPGRRGGDKAQWRKFLAKAPLSDAAQRDLARLFENRKDKDYMSGLSPSEKEERLERMLTTSFEEMELSIRDQLARSLAGGGFDPAEDILGITVNRWPHGYAYTPDTLSDPDVPEAERPHVVGRQPFGRMAIANSDAGAAAFTNTAIDEAHRAVFELARTREPY